MLRVPLRCVSAAFLGCALGLSGLRAEFTERFDKIGVDRSIYVKDGLWKKYGTGATAQPAANTAIVGSENGQRHLTITSVGHPTASARAFANVELPVTETSNKIVSCSIRAITPDSPDELLTNVNVGFNALRDGVFDPTGGLSFGILGSGSGASFFVEFGKGNRIQSRPDTTPVNPKAWYRFTVEIQPSTGGASFRVQEVTPEMTRVVWSGTSAGLPRYSPQYFSQINLIVSRPGSSPTKIRSADFAAISVTP